MVHKEIMLGRRREGTLEGRTILFYPVIKGTSRPNETDKDPERHEVYIEEEYKGVIQFKPVFIPREVYDSSKRAP